MNKTILVLAASTYQIPAIKTAKRQGYRVITTDNLRANAGHSLADASFGVDTTDFEGVLALAKREGVSGVVAPGTDVAVMTAAYVAEQLHLPGPTFLAARTLTEKLCFREFLKQAGLPCPAFFRVAKGAFPEDSLFDGRKWVVKPNRASGSKGVFIVSALADLRKCIAETLAFSVDSTAVLEEFIEGTQHTCEGVLQHGRIAQALVTDRDTAPPPHTATTGHRVPSLLPGFIQSKALGVIEQVLCRLSVTSGPFDCDFVADGDRIVLIELTPRLGGNSLSKLFHSALNFDLVAYAVRNACQDLYPLPAPRLPQPRAIAILGVDRCGRLAWNEQEEEALRKESWLEELILDLPQGAQVKAFVNGRHRVGEALITGADRAELDGRLAEFKQRLALTAV